MTRGNLISSRLMFFIFDFLLDILLLDFFFWELRVNRDLCGSKWTAFYLDSIYIVRDFLRLR